jgi:hypothetical protein
MPVLKSYTDGSGCYIHASIRGTVITFQTTQRGVERLKAAGVNPGGKLSLRLLADLSRDGDAFTRRGGVEFHEAEQFQFDFSESEESKALFPACARTGKFDDLHLVAHGSGGEVQVELLSPTARLELSDSIRLSVPLLILSPPAVRTLEESGQIPCGSAAVASLRTWYAQEASAEWERLRKQHQTRQQGFDLDDGGRLKL